MFQIDREYSIPVKFIPFRWLMFTVNLFLTGLLSTCSVHIHVNLPSAVATFSCGPNEYYSMEAKRCDWCSSCSIGRTIKKQCTRYTNTVCEPCPPGTFSEREGDLCIPCGICPLGQFVQKECSNSSDRMCVGCPMLTFSDKENSRTCRPCRICKTFETTLKRCTVSSDSECGECRPGYFRMHATDECWKCSPCYPEHEGLTFVMSECQRKVNDSNMTCMPTTPPFMPALQTGNGDTADRTQSENIDHVEKHILTGFSMTISVTALILLTIIILFVIYIKYWNRTCNIFSSSYVDNIEECLVENKKLYVDNIEECLVENKKLYVDNIEECLVENKKLYVDNTEECLVENKKLYVDNIEECLVENKKLYVDNTEECLVENKKLYVDNIEECLVENKKLGETNAPTLSTNCKSNDSDSGLSSGNLNIPTESNMTSSSLTKSRKTKRERDELLKGRSASTPASIRPLLRTLDSSDEALNKLKDNGTCDVESKACNFEKNDSEKHLYFEVEDDGIYPVVTVSEVNECSSEADDEEELSIHINFEDCHRRDPKINSPDVTSDDIVGLDKLLSVSKEGEMCKMQGKKEKRKKKRRQRREEASNSRRPFVDLSYFSVHTILS